MRLPAAALITSLLLGASAPGQADETTFGPELQGFYYAFPVRDFTFESQRQTLHMAYVDVAPTGTSTGRTVVLLHGKNFCADTWAETIRQLSAAGDRVIAPDQIGFCKSSKPAAYQFSFRQLAQNTRDLLASLGVTRATIVGHSTGGMLATRYALLFPDAVERLVLVDPIGLEDGIAKGVPPIGIDQWYGRELKTTAASIKAYEQATYYAGHWEPRYDRWVETLAGLFAGPGGQAVAWDASLLDDMIMTQPVVYELGRLRVPTVLMIGDKGVTAIGKDLAPPAVRASLGDYPALGHAAAEAITGAKLVEFAALGHAPQIQDPALFQAALAEALAGTLPDRSVR